MHLYKVNCFKALFNVIFYVGHDLIFEVKKRFRETSNIYDGSAFTALRVRFTAGPAEPKAWVGFPAYPFPHPFYANQLTPFQPFTLLLAPLDF